MRRFGILVTAVAIVAAPATVASAADASALTGQEPRHEPAAEQPEVDSSAPDRIVEPDAVLDGAWQESSDRAVTTVGDATGLHVLVADRRDAYQWRTVATLAEPMLESDQWIGQHCTTGSGDYAVVVYAPRTFTNDAVLMERGAFAAVVDLTSGVVTKLDQRVTLAYYNPTCGPGDTAALSRLEHSEASDAPAQSWIGFLAADEATWRSTVRVDGQVTSVTPTRDSAFGVKGYDIVEIGAAGDLDQVARFDGQPFRLHSEGADGLAFQVARGDRTDLMRFVNDDVHRVATVPLGTVKLRPGAGGTVYAAGVLASERMAQARSSPWEILDALPDSDISTEGGLVVERATTGREAAARLAFGPAEGMPEPVRIEATVRGLPGAGAEVVFESQPVSGVEGREPTPAPGMQLLSPSSGAPDNAVTADPATTPWDPDRACAVPRNDPEIQVYQPSAEQVEWAANLAVRGQLDFQRPANWLNNGLPAYSPQGYFPSLDLVGGGHVPAQIYLAILAQESNLWQASYRVVDALAGNPMTSSGFYGIHWEDQDPTTIDWSEVDCGYGAAQVTTGMHTDDTDTVVTGVHMDYTKQKAVVLDYATNIAAGLRILQDKWNETRSAGLIPNDGDPRYLENWWFAVWAYNTGFYPDSGGGEPWGLGWSNNPAAPVYPPDRQMFLTAPLDHPDVDPPDEVGYDNAKHPNHWSYPERVIGFAYTSLIRWDYATQSYQDTYRPADWQSVFTFDAQPDHHTFCVEQVNQCDPDAEHEPGDFPGYPAGPCLRDDLRCWWNGPVSWVPSEWDGCEFCGVESRRFTTVEPRPLASSIYSSKCSMEGLPASAQVITTVRGDGPVGPQGCAPTWTDGGSFDLQFEPFTNASGDTVFPGKVDLHQIGGGFGGHFFFAHSHGDGNSPMKVTGTYRPTTRLDGWVRVMAHLPDHGARTQQAPFKVNTGTEIRERYLPMRRMEHSWVTIGTYEFSSTGDQYVELSNITGDGRGVDNVTWDAVAFAPLPAKPDDFVVAIGDSYISGDGGGDYYAESDNNFGTHRWNACRRSEHAWPRQLVIPGSTGSIGSRVDGHNTSIDFQLLACSGSTAQQIRNTTPPGYWQNPPGSVGAFMDASGGQHGEVSQLESGALSDDTTLVLLSAGGNDAGFGSVLEECALTDCASFEREQELRQDIFDAQVHVRGLIDDVSDRAPNALVMLVGYPMLFSEDIYNDPFHPLGRCAVVYSQSEAMMINSLAHDMRDAQRQTVLQAAGEGVNVAFVDLVQRFGNHGACPSASVDEEIHAVVAGPQGGGDARSIEGVYACPGFSIFEFCISRESFHPKQSGHGRFAGAVADRLWCGESCVGSRPPGLESGPSRVVP